MLKSSVSSISAISISAISVSAISALVVTDLSMKWKLQSIKYQVKKSRSRLLKSQVKKILNSNKAGNDSCSCQ